MNRSAIFIGLFILIVVFGIAFIFRYNKFHTPEEVRDEAISPENNQAKVAITNKNMTITSPIFQDNEYMNERYTCDGQDKNPPLRFGEIPQDAKSLVLIVDDPDAPGGNFTHWLLWNISPNTDGIKEDELPVGSVQGENSAGKIGYMGPCPPAGRAHHYQFKLFALDTVLDLPEGVHQSELESRIQKHTLDSDQVVGLYARSSIPR
jgi:Raf kinase inhibitor-like YbhB/YbcL family protein